MPKSTWMMWTAMVDGGWGMTMVESPLFSVHSRRRSHGGKGALISDEGKRERQGVLLLVCATNQWSRCVLNTISPINIRMND